VGNLVFSLFDGGMGAVLLSVMVVSAGSTLWGEKTGTTRVAKPGAWDSLRCEVIDSWQVEGF
jgi:hypothetical protein